MTQKPNIGNLVGTWTYRSLFNNPNVSTDFRKLEFARAHISIDDAPMGVFKGRIFGTDWSLDLDGAIGYGTPWTVFFQANGFTKGAEWLYNFTGYVVPPWPNGVDQRPAIVGSVTRLRGAANEPVNIVCSFYAVRTDSRITSRASRPHVSARKPRRHRAAST